MPFAPLHMGPALALNGGTGRHFFVLVFGTRPGGDGYRAAHPTDPTGRGASWARPYLLGHDAHWAEIGWFAAMTGAFVGTYTHILFDLLMRAETKPLVPWSDHSSRASGIIPTEHLNYICMGAGLVGIVLRIARATAR